MKGFLLKSLAFGCCVMCLLGLLLCFAPRHSDSYLCAYQRKVALLDTVPSPRLIFVGGSNLAFGLDSRRIRDSLGLPVVNYGLHAGIGLKYMLDDVKKYARQGDIVVFAPEYEQFYTAMYGENTCLTEVMALRRWHGLRELNFAQLRCVLVGIPGFLAQRWLFGSDGGEAYRASGFNEFGDEVAHWEAGACAVAWPKSVTKPFHRRFGAYFVAGVRELQSRCTVLIVPPVCTESGFEGLRTQAAEIAAFLRRERLPNYPPPQKFVLPDFCAYDTKYHMNKEGVDRFTVLLLEQVRPYAGEE